MNIAGRIIGGLIAVLALAPATGASAAAVQPDKAGYCHNYYYNYDRCEHGSGGGWGRHEEPGEPKHGDPHRNG